MDYFDTAKKYRNKRIKKLISILINIIILLIVAIIAWQIGVRDRNNIIAVHSSELIRIANEFKDKLYISMDVLFKGLRNQNSPKFIANLRGKKIDEITKKKHI